MTDYAADAGGAYGVAQNGVQSSAGPAHFEQQGQAQGYGSAPTGGAENSAYTPRADDQSGRAGPSGNQGHMPQTYQQQGYSTGPRITSGGPPPGMGGTAFVPGKIFIGGLANTTTKDQLESYCAQWGEMSDIVLMEGRGFGFVTYAEPQCAQAFLEKKDHELDHKKIEAKAAVPKNAGGSSGLTRKMFVGGTGELGEEEFRAHFAQFGDIEDCVILRKPDGTSRGFGFVTYRDESMVEKCLVVTHTINGKTVEVKRAVKKEDMAAGAGYDQSYAARTGKAPDWHCPDCRNKNFGWREVCNRCQAPKPPQMGGGMGMMSGGMMGGMRSGYGSDGSYMGGGMGMGMGMGGGMGGHGSMGMANMGSMSPQMADMGGMGAMAGYSNMGGMGANMGPMGGYGGGMGGRGAMGSYGGMQTKMSPQMGMGGMGGNYGGGAGGYNQMQQGSGYGPAYSEGSGSGYDMSGGQPAGGYGGGAGAGGAYGGGAGYGGGQGVGGAYGGSAGYGGNATAAYGDGSGGYGQQGSYGRAAPGRGNMGHSRYRPY